MLVVFHGCVSFRSFVYFQEIIPVVSEGGTNKLRIKFSYRRLEKQKTKRRKGNAKASRKTSSFSKDSDKSTVKLPMAKPNIAQLKVIAADLQKQCDYVNKMIDLQENYSTEHKNCEKNSRVPGKRVTRVGTTQIKGNLSVQNHNERLLNAKKEETNLPVTRSVIH